MVSLIKKWWNVTWKEFKVNCIGVCRISLSCFDDKRYILDNGIIFIKL